MGRRLYEAQPAFRAALDRCAALLEDELERPLLDVMWSGPDAPDAALHRTEHTQPALFALEYALSELWRSWGVEPDVVMGHSVGEIGAACVAGVFSLHDALRLVAARGRLMGALPAGGAMVALAAEEARVAAHVAPVADRVAIAAVNGPAHVVISGAEDAVVSIAAALAAEGVKTRRLVVSHAFHSPLMRPMLADLRRVAETIAYRSPRVALITGIDGRRATDAIAGPEHWVRHAEAPVLFARGLSSLETEGVNVLLEVGPHAVLLDLASGLGASRVPSLARGEDDAVVALEARGRLFVGGVPAAQTAPPPEPRLVVLSARSESALSAQAARLGAHLEAHPSLSLGDVAFSLATTRSPLEHRLAVAVSTRDVLVAALGDASKGETPPGSVRGRVSAGAVPKVVFVFPGQGSQWLGMGRRLLAEEPVFRAAIEECDRAIHSEAGWSLLAELDADEAASRLDRIDVVQPVLFAIAVALAALWRSWGVTPDAVVGHSLGEVAAAHVAGALSLEEATAIICRRSALLRRLRGQGDRGRTGRGGASPGARSTRAILVSRDRRGRAPVRSRAAIRAARDGRPPSERRRRDAGARGRDRRRRVRGGRELGARGPGRGASPSGWGPVAARPRGRRRARGPGADPARPDLERRPTISRAIARRG